MGDSDLIVACSVSSDPAPTPPTQIGRIGESDSSKYKRKRQLRFQAIFITRILLSLHQRLRYSSFQLRLLRYTKTKSGNVSLMSNSRGRYRYPSRFFKRRRRGLLSFGSELVWTLPRTTIQQLQELDGHGNLFVKEI